MSADLGTLSLAAVSIGFVHCISGPDHYVPFVAMSRVGVWSLRKTLMVTLLCGLGHVASSVLVGAIGVGLAMLAYQIDAVREQLTRFESFRGEIAAWLLVTFGVLYTGFGIRHALKRHRHSHGEASDGTTASLTPWVLFTVFLFGPCEPLIPLMMYSGASLSIWNATLIALLFSATTLLTMTVIVAALHRGVSLVAFRGTERYGHALAGAAVTICGLAILCLGF